MRIDYLSVEEGHWSRPDIPERLKVLGENFPGMMAELRSNYMKDRAVIKMVIEREDGTYILYVEVKRPYGYGLDIVKLSPEKEQWNITRKEID